MKFLTIPLFIFFNLFVFEKALGSESKIEKKFVGQLGYGFETNVFQSQSNPQDDFFLLAEGSAHLVLSPSSKDKLYADLFGSYQAFQRLSNANQFFLDGSLDLQHTVHSSFEFGVSQIFSYNDLKLLDTEGEPLPREKIGSVNYQARAYTLLYPGEDWGIELGGGYRRKDVEETGGFTSLDLNTIFVDGGLRNYFTQLSFFRFKYLGSYIVYDRLIAGSPPSGLPQFGNAGLVLIRHEGKIKFYLREFKKLHIIGMGNFRYNEDTFMDDLTYVQYEGIGKIKARLFWKFYLDLSGAYRIRDYRTRASNVFLDLSTGNIFVSPDKLEERFLILESSIRRKFISFLELSLRYTWIKKNTNAIGGDFESTQGLIGFRAVF